MHTASGLKQSQNLDAVKNRELRPERSITCSSSIAHNFNPTMESSTPVYTLWWMRFFCSPSHNLRLAKKNLRHILDKAVFAFKKQHAYPIFRFITSIALEGAFFTILDKLTAAFYSKDGTEDRNLFVNERLTLRRISWNNLWSKYPKDHKDDTI